ncbi:MAG: hypothetical protein IJ444_02260 [Kiritimatiellae bacterium]|nr:hypothetical protein [Kiritimatiellia bacterium]
MAIITFNINDGSVSVLVEKTDLIRKENNGTICTQNAKHYGVGTVLVNEDMKLCMVRGERE